MGQISTHRGEKGRAKKEDGLVLIGIPQTLYRVHILFQIGEESFFPPREFRPSKEKGGLKYF